MRTVRRLIRIETARRLDWTPELLERGRDAGKRPTRMTVQPLSSRPRPHGLPHELSFFHASAAGSRIMDPANPPSPPGGPHETPVRVPDCRRTRRHLHRPGPG